MRVVHPSIYLKQHQQARRKRRNRKIWLTIVFLLITAYGVLAYLVKPVYEPTVYGSSLERQVVDLPWPTSGSASIGEIDSDLVMGQSKGNSVLPTASTIKILTALVLLKEKPLGETEIGPIISFDEADVASTEALKALGASVFTVAPGTSLTYREALDVMLLQSANNIADKLAVWGFGSNDAYLLAAKNYADVNRLSKTVISDASGLSPDTKSTANDLLTLTKLALSDPLVKQIVSQKTATLSDGTVVTNTNQLLGDGYTGVKTGFTNEAGACLLLSKETVVKGRKIEAIVVLQGQVDRQTANTVGQDIMGDFLAGYMERQILSKDQAVGFYLSPWGSKTPILAHDNLLIVSYIGSSVNGLIDANESITEGKKGDAVGVFSAEGSSMNVDLGANLPSAPITWRLRHALDFIWEKL